MRRPERVGKRVTGSGVVCYGHNNITAASYLDGDLLPAEGVRKGVAVAAVLDGGETLGSLGGLGGERQRGGERGGGAEGHGGLQGLPPGHCEGARKEEVRSGKSWQMDACMLLRNT
jgi:hypothetical protein